MKPLREILLLCLALPALLPGARTAQGAEPAFSAVENPRIPMSMTFAGEKIDLDRVDMAERLDRELTSLAYTHGNTLLMIKRANRLFPMMAPVLESNGVPLDLLYLACVESTLDIRAYSPAKAAGIWQFMPSTGKQYGLEINDYVDERYDVYKETRAACRYLKKAYDKYGNWESVAAAFNGGMSRIDTELEAQGVSSSFDLHLTRETGRCGVRVLAVKAVMETPSAFGFRLDADQLYQPVECDIAEVDSAIDDWPEWALERGITYAQLREQTPWIRAKSLPNKTGKVYRVRIPKKESLYRSGQKRTVYDPRWTAK